MLQLRIQWLLLLVVFVQSIRSNSGEDSSSSLSFSDLLSRGIKTGGRKGQTKKSGGYGGYVPNYPVEVPNIPSVGGEFVFEQGGPHGSNQGLGVGLGQVGIGQAGFGQGGFGQGGFGQGGFGQGGYVQGGFDQGGINIPNIGIDFGHGTGHFGQGSQSGSQSYGSAQGGIHVPSTGIDFGHGAGHFGQGSQSGSQGYGSAQGGIHVPSTGIDYGYGTGHFGQGSQSGAQGYGSSQADFLSPGYGLGTGQGPHSGAQSYGYSSTGGSQQPGGSYSPSTSYGGAFPSGSESQAESSSYSFGEHKPGANIQFGGHSQGYPGSGGTIQTGVKSPQFTPSQGGGASEDHVFDSYPTGGRKTVSTKGRGGVKTTIKTQTQDFLEDSRSGQKCDIEAIGIMNAEISCNLKGCKATCFADYQFPSGERFLPLQCADGVWKVETYETIPSCLPVCLPACQNDGICISPGKCQCPQNFQGPICSQPNIRCLNKIATKNAKSHENDHSTGTVQCLKGYQFPDGSTIQNVRCTKNETWEPTNLECKPICKPPCVNGGTCIAPNMCKCKENYRGPSCDYDIAVCNHTKLHFKGNLKCAYGMEYANCSISCPENISFEFPPADEYICYYSEGSFEPRKVPKCNLPEGVSFVEGSKHTQYGYQKGRKESRRTYKKTEYSYEDEDEEWEEFMIKAVQKIKRRNRNKVEMDEYDYTEIEIPGTYTMYTSSSVGVSYRTPKPALCTTWNGRNVKTFDGMIYTLPLYCTHTLVQDYSDGSFNVAMSSCEGDLLEFCPHSLKVFLQNLEYVFVNNNGVVQMSTEHKTWPIPVHTSGMKVTPVAQNLKIELEAVGLVILWDMYQRIQIEASASLWNRTSGLCGTLDGNHENEFMSKDGNLLTTPKTFVDSWRTQDKCGMDLSAKYVVDIECDSKNEELALSVCMKLLSNVKLEGCVKKFSRTALVQFCYNDFCSCFNKENPATCSCQFMATLAKDCQLQGVKLEHGWRDLEICPVNCTNGKIYLGCGPSMEPMCGSTTVPTKNVCTEGCFCPEGTVRYKDECVPVEQCPCRLRKKDFKPGSKIKKDCNTCTCESGTWKCTDITCGARCGAVGDPHYSTFDGKKYDFMGKCSYYLMKTDNLTIEAENIACPGSISEAMNFAPTLAVDMPSCTKSLTIKMLVDGEPTIIKLRQGRLVYVNNEEVTKYPKVLGSNAIATMRQPSSILLSVDFADGVRVWWDGMTRAYIDVPPTYRGKTQGLCGTFNSQQSDDFLTPEGDIEGVAEQFANKWRTKETCEFLSDTKPPHPCLLNVERREMAEKLCDKLNYDIFDKCHWAVDPDTFYQDCLYDVCACNGDVNSCFCPILAAYSAECTRQEIITNWRYNIPECAVTCPAGQVYDECGDSCVRTCEDVATKHVCRGHCVEGCRCPAGQYLNDKNECIPAKHCPCIYDGFTFETGYREVRPGRKFQELCTCDGGVWDCDIAKPGDELLYPPASVIKAQCTNQPYAEFSKCLPLEPKTCKNMGWYKEDYKGCKPGCGCKPGYVLDTSRKECVIPENCSCHHGGISYGDGAKIKEDCNTCKCKGGQWVCTQNQCAATCSIWGDSHFSTFDGKEFEFQGECDYVLSKGAQLNGDSYAITIQNVLCGSMGVTCSKSVEISLSGSVTDTIKLSSDPLQTTSLQKYKKFTPEASNQFTVYNAGLLLVVEVPSLGLQVKWDRGTRVYVKLNGNWKNKVTGLCGNYNGDEQDDMKTPSLGIETSSLLFGHSWKLEDSCSVPTEQIDACREHPERKTWAQRKCGILKSKTFQACHSEVPVDKYLRRCTFDTCACDQGGDCECLCTAIAAYVYECATKGINIKWRTPQLCPMQCDAHCSYYSECVPSCPVETCDNYLEQGMQERICATETCFEGCAIKPCEEGKIYLNDTFLECVPKSECKPICLVKDGAVFYEGDITKSDDCHSCYCSRKQEVCKGSPCTTTPRPPIPQYTPPMATEEQECVEGWTKWFNEDQSSSSQVAGADDAQLALALMKKQNDVEKIPKYSYMQSFDGHAICPKKFIKKIECRTVVSHLTPEQTGENVDCTLDQGLICIGDCHDYEIRLYCGCSDEPTWEKTPLPPLKPTPTPTPFRPPYECDITVSSIQVVDDCHKFKQCLQQVGGTYTYVEKTCGPTMLYNPNTMTCDWYDTVVAIRPECKRELLVQTTVPPFAPLPTTPVPIIDDRCVPLPPKDCYNYYECIYKPDLQKYANEPRTCGPSLMYNPVKKICDSFESVALVKPECLVYKTVPPVDVPRPPPLVGQECDPAKPNVDYPGDCTKYLQCLMQLDGKYIYVTQNCGPGTYYHPYTMNCGWPNEVIKVKPECGKVPEEVEFIRTTPIPPPPAKLCDPSVPFVEYPADCHKYLACLQQPDGSWKHVQKSCGRNMYNHLTGKCDSPVKVIEIRPDCEVPDTRTTVPIPLRCPPGKVWSECAIPCGRACHYYGKLLYEQHLCRPDSGICEEGCVDSSAAVSCERNMFWRDMETCVEPAHCTCVSNNGKMVKPYEKIEESECDVCQCINNEYVCTTKASCLEQPEPHVQATTQTPFKTTIKVIIPATVYPPIKCDERNFVPLISGASPLPDSVFSASTSLGPYFLPHFARLHNKPTAESSGSWSPEVNDQMEYLQITFPEPTPLYGIITQGSPLYDNYVTQFKILYSLDGHVYYYLTDNDAEILVLDGSVDPKTAIKSVFPVPIEAKYVRIYPLKWTGSIAFRVELLGCSWTKTTTELSYTDVMAEELTEAPPTIYIDEKIKPVCDEPMGVESGKLSESQVSASSVKPSGLKGREPSLLSQLRPSSPRGWRPITDSTHEFVMFDFLAPRNITGVKTLGGSNSWVKSFYVLYSPNGFVWNKVTTPEGLAKLFVANVDPINPKVNYFKHPIQATKLKIVPAAWHKSIEMKIEPIGCFQPYPVTETTLPPTLPPFEVIKECGICDNVKEVGGSCFCKKPSYWNGEACVDKLHCPCMVGQIPYEVGAVYETETCERCSCLLGGVPKCEKKVCPPCEPGLRRARFDCSCACEKCPEFQRLCPSSGDCIPEAVWCNGVKDCEDDETGCESEVIQPMTAKETQEYNYTKICPVPSCPEGMILQQVEKRKPVKMSAVFTQSPRKKGGRGGVKRKPITNPNFGKPLRKLAENQPIEECIEYICIPRDKPLISESHTKEVECHTPVCNEGYEVELQSKPHAFDECPSYGCVLKPKKDVVCVTNGRTFKTFDDTEFKYDICSHMLARNLDSDNWSVTLYKNCTVGEYRCLKEVAIRDKESNYEIWLYQDFTVKLDGRLYTVRQLENAANSQGGFVISQPGRTILFVSRPHGFWVSFDETGEVKVGVSSKYINLVDGLCGFYNGKPVDDKRLPDGSPASSTIEFGDSWFTSEIPKANCEPHACSQEHQEKALAMCNLIRQETFSPCIKAVDYDRFISMCLETVCDCIRTSENQDIYQTEKNCKCTALESFVKQCLTINPAAYIDSWRPVYGCEVECPAPLVHRDCFRRRCEPSCSNLGTEECPLIPNFCFSGCYCPEGTVRKGSLCVPATECRDCVCDSLPNSNYLTYDRQNFTFDGNCTYLLTRDIMLPGVHTFQVYATVGDCKVGATQPTKTKAPAKLRHESCAKSLHILFGEHIIHVQRNDDWSLNVIVDGIEVKNLPLTAPWINIKEEYGKELSILLPESQVEVKSSFSDLSFSIQVPSIKFGSKMEGLCGDCNGNPDNDLQVNPIKIKDYPSPSFVDIINSWQADEPKLGLAAEMCKTEEEVTSDCIPLPPETDPCFKIFDEDIFGQCHLIVDPSIYISNCQQDMCKPGNDQIGACASLAAYARECARHGVCVSWRSHDFCPYDCPNYLEYDPCGCTFTCDTVKFHGLFDVIMTDSNTAVKTKKSQLECLEERTEGCYCPRGTVFNNGKCIKQEECVKCDEEGHYPGDYWYPDKCTKCACNSDGKTVCSKETCSLQDIICQEGYAVQQIESVVECCPKFICVPKATEAPLPCPEVSLPDCPVDQQKKLIKGSDGCPYYICECKPPSECRRIDIPRPIKEGEIVVTDKSGCCEVPKIVCDKTKCRPKPEYCPIEFYEILESNVEDCCPSYDCIPPKHACIVTIRGQKTLKQIGEKWRNPDEPCLEKVCTYNAEGLPTETSTKTTVCEKCPRGFEAVVPAGECCGKCVAKACVWGDDFFQPGQVWYSDDNCTSHLCLIENDQFHIVKTEKACPDISSCPLEQRYQDGCCLACKADMNCRPVPVAEDTIGIVQVFAPIHNKCTNRYPIPELTQCQGTCPSGTRFNSKKTFQEKYCDCCHPTELKDIEVLLECEDRNTITRSVKVPVSCSCQTCVSEGKTAAIKSTPVKGGGKGSTKG